MLVLSRKINETIIIGGNVRITLTMIRGHQVRVSIAAPREVPVYRAELLGKEGTAPGISPAEQPGEYPGRAAPTRTAGRSQAPLTGIARARIKRSTQRAQAWD